MPKSATPMHRRDLPSLERFQQVYNLVQAHIEQRYDIPVIICDVVDPFTGDLDGREIRIDYDRDVEEALFIMTHLFGHTVQWNLSQEAREIGARVARQPTEEQLLRLHAYEQEACRYGLQLLHQAGVVELDGWLADFAACDFSYLRHFYKTGEKLPFHGFWRSGMPLLLPLPIPRFTPTRWVSRQEGIVV